MAQERKIRVLVAKPGLDGHDRGAKVIARALRDAGMEVIYTGLRQTPEMIVNAALQEDVDCIGLSILSGAHNAIVPRVMDLLRHNKMGDVLVVVGGTIPGQDLANLKKAGVGGIFGPGTPMDQIIQFILIGNGATVKACAFFPMTAKKVIRAQNIAIENHIPTIYLVDSAGVFLPLQEDVFPDTDDFGRVFRNNAVMSAMGIPQIAAIMGMCVAGGGYLPVMCDHVLMTDGSGLFLAGPALVQAAIGQKVSAEELGGAAMHAAISGTVDFREPNDEACLRRIRSIIDKWGYRRQSPWDRRKPIPAALAAEEIYGIYDSSSARPYDMKEIIARIVDASAFDEYKAEYGKTLVCGYARIGGFAVGIVANQKMHAQATDHEGKKRMEFGGVIYTESAEKAARFIMDCNQNLIPLIFLHDVNGFMVGRDAEWSGIIKAGAKMVNAVSNSVVPKITVIVGGSFGAGHYAMCGKAYDPRFVFAWPTAKYAVMSGDAAAGTLVEIKIRQLERSGKVLSDEEKKQLYESVKQSYDEQMDPRYGAARLWIDRIIDPMETRDAITIALEAAALNPDVAMFKVGVLQT